MKKLHPFLAFTKRFCGLFILLWGLTFAQSGRAQFLDCSCLATQAVLFTNGCVGIIPDLCTVVSNCWFPNASSTGFTCIQNPPAGTVVTAVTPISFTLFDQPSNTPYTCNPVFYVGASSNRFTLICASNLVVDCNSTNFSFPPPTWTNAMCCTNVILSGPTLVTNWPVITASWLGFACGVVDSCSQTVTFVQTNGLACDCLDIFCSTNIIVPTCLGTTAGNLTNVFWPPPVVSNYCIGTITNIVCIPPSGSPFPVGTNTVTCIVQDDLGNVETCQFAVIVLPDLVPPNVACANLTVPCGSPWSPVPPPAFDACCGTNNIKMLQSIFTNVLSQCETKIFLDWHVTDCRGNSTNCSEVITIVDLTPPVIQCTSNRTVQCGITAAGTPGPWVPTPPPAFDACCPTPPIVSLVSSNSTGTPCNQLMTLDWMAVDCCTNISYCTELVTIVDTTPPAINCQPFRVVDCGTNIVGDPPTAFDACCGTNVTVSILNIITNIQTTCFSSYLIIWQATDCCTNSITCPQQVNVVDSKPPNFLCAPDTNINCGQPLIFTPPTAFDDCCGGLVTISPLGLLTNAAASCPYSVMARWLISDCCGNVTNCQQTIHIVDTVPPVITCGPNQTVPCGSAWSLSTPTAFDACCSASITPFLQSITTNSSPPCLEVITAVWATKDCCNNQATCTEIVTIVDTTPPVILCNSNQTYACTPAGTPGGWQPVPPAAFDVCCGPIAPVVSLVSATTNGNQCIQTINLVWSATDCCTNTAYCTETITIVDTQPPTLNCQPFRQVECGSNFLGDLPTAFDLCCGTNVTVSVLNIITNVTGTCFSSYTVIWQAVDCCTNIATCPQQINVVDSTPPNVLCPPNTNVACGQPLIFTPPTAFDNCCGAAVTVVLQNVITNAAGVVCPYSVTAHWLITDCCGNATNCNQTIDILDTVPPVLTCAPNQTVPCGSTWSLLPPTATDACCPASAINVSLQTLFTNNTPPCLQVVTAVWRAVDCCQNTSFCTNTVSVVDVTPPNIQCKSNQVFACGAGPTGVGWQPTPPSAFDVCCGPIAPLVSLVNSITNGNQCNLMITLTWSATDCCSNIAFCTETVSIIDTNPPILTCAPLKFVECGTAWTFDPPTAFDLCCGTNVTINVASNITVVSSPCFSIYEQFWTATDCCSNTTVCSQRVIEQDTLPPMVICPTNQIVQCGQPVVFGTPIASDLCCPAAGILILPQPTVTNSVSPCLKVLVKNWVIADCCGNATTCTQLIEIIDTTPPVIVCGANQTIQCGNPFIPNPPVSVTDACCGTIVSMSLATFTTNSTGPCSQTISAVWTATDCCNNSASCTNFVFVVDTLPPVINCPPGPRVVQCGQPLLPPTASDLCCPNVTLSLLSSITNTVSSCTNQVIRTWQAIDCCTNSTTCVETNLIVDLAPPSIACLPPVWVQCGTPIVFTPPTAFDACCGTNVTIINAGTTVFGSSTCFRIHLRQWQAVDCCGNVTNCNQIIVEQDTTPPVITGVSNQTIQCQLLPGPFPWPPVSAIDACCGTNVTLSVVSNSVSGMCPRIHVRVTKATDCCGNSSFITQTVTEVDTIPPIIGCPPNFTVNVGSPWNFGSPLAGDSCCPAGVFVVSTITNTVNQCIRNVTRTWIAYDCCSNSATCSQTVSIVRPPPPNDLCQNAFPLIINAPPICGSNICATPSLPGSLTNTPCGSSVNAPDVWYVMTPTCSGMVRINTCNPCTGFPMYDTVLSAYTGPCPGTLTQVPGGCNDDLCGLQSIINIPVVAGQTYYIRVSGFAGAMGWFGLQAQQLTTIAPTNDFCSNAIPVTVGSPAACGTTECATPSLSNNIPIIPIPCAGSINANDVWYTFTPTCTGPVTVNTCGTCPGSNTFNTVLSTYTGTCGALSQIACNNNVGVPGCTLQSSNVFLGIAGVTYYFRVSGVGTAAGQFRLNVSQNVTPPPNDICATAIPITPGTYAWNNCGATSTGPSATCATFFHDIWYRFTATCAGPVWINTCGTTLNTYLAVYTNTCAVPAQIACNDNATAGPCPSSPQSFVSFNAFPGITYFIRVGTPSGVMGPGQLTLVGPTPPFGTCPAPGPSSCKMFRILGNPNCIPWSWSLSSPCCAFVGASSAGPVCSGNANNLAAAFVASINSVCPSMNAIAIPMPSPNQGRFIVCSPCGTNLTLSVGAAGAPPISQCVVANTGGWSPIPVGWCAFNPDIDEVPPSGHDYNGNGLDDAFDIDLGTSEDKNANGIPDEADCLLPDVDIIPAGHIVQLGDELQLIALTTGTTPLSYQWHLNGSPIAGANSDTYLIASVKTADAGLYCVTASNLCGAATSPAVEVRLSQPVLLDAAFEGGEFQFTVHTKTGFNYVIEYKNDLNDPTWTPLTTIPGNGEPQVVTDPSPATQMRYYRARSELSP